MRATVPALSQGSDYSRFIMEIIKGTDNITKAIASIATRGKKLDADIQQAGMSILAHVDEHGDTTLADKLLAAMPKGSRKLALVEWMLAFGKVQVLNKKNPKHAARIKLGQVMMYAKDKTTDLDAAMEKAWYEFKPERAVVDAFDAQAAVKALLARVTGAAGKGIEVKNRAMAIEELKALTAALQAEPVTVADDVGEADE